MTILNLDFKKIDQTRLNKGVSKKTGDAFAYGELVLVEFKDGPREQNGITKHGIVKQGVTKEERESGVDMPIIGDFRIIGGSSSRPAGEHSSKPRPLPTRPAAHPDPDLDTDGDDIPF